MATAEDSRFCELCEVLDTTISYLQTVREPEWARRLADIRGQLDIDRPLGIRSLLAAFDGPESIDRLYLSGPRNGHNLSERQEIEANGKLYELRSYMRDTARQLQTYA